MLCCWECNNGYFPCCVLSLVFSREVLIKELFFPCTQPFQMPLASMVSPCFAAPSLVQMLQRPVAYVFPVTREMELLMVPFINLQIWDSVISGFMTDEARNGQPPPRVQCREGSGQQGQHLPVACPLVVTYLSAVASNNYSAGNQEGKENAKEPHSPASGLLLHTGSRQGGTKVSPGWLQCWLRGERQCHAWWPPIDWFTQPSLCSWCERCSCLCSEV